MTQERVIVSADVYLALSTYALATEKEETLAMLMGSTTADGVTVTVTHCLFCQRKDKRRDRVEISSEQLSQAISHADATGTAVVGWAHSHPHITVLPSHVDLRCQRDQQMLSDAFVGVIVSVFNDFKGVQRVQVIAFRSLNDGGELRRIEVPIFIQPCSGIKRESLQQLLRIPQIFLQEEKEFFTKACTQSRSGVGDGAVAAASDAREDRIVTSHYSGVYVRNLTSVLDKLCVPMVQAFVERHERNMAEIEALKERLKVLG
ncbi:lys-63-specific deubiquitinase BRCC36-like protein [Chytriomyces sp. MP71]|nr:lys-63-specific deubiquitinase BRCC36-like protein [Chytriomyces sp. MP71]